MEVKCKKTSCGFNKSTICMAKEITIGAFQGCQSYVDKPSDSVVDKNKKINRFETSEDMTAYIHSANKEVNCNCLDCKFNCDTVCSCNGITLANDKDTGICVSHIDK